MGNAASKGMWTDKMYREREKTVNEAMRHMQMTPIVATFDETWCNSKLFQFPLRETLLQQHDIWGLEVGFNKANLPKHTFIRQMKQHYEELNCDTWYHIVVKMGEHFFVPRFRTNICNDTYLFDLAKKRTYIRLVCVLNKSIPFSEDITDMWVYPTIYDKTMCLIITPNNLNTTNQLSFIATNNVHFIQLDSNDPSTQLRTHLKRLSIVDVNYYTASDSSDSHILKNTTLQETQLQILAHPDLVKEENNNM